MEYNLKNRPLTRIDGKGKPWKEDKQWEQWFEGFEKELRKMLEQRHCYFIDKQTIKEILGK